MISQINIPNWQKKYETGIPDIDFQHQYFLHLIKRFYKRANEGMEMELIVSHINEIIHYASFHFCSEENLMRMHNYLAFEEHQKMHVEIIQRVSNKISLFELNELSCNEIVQFLIDWFIEHTVQEDVKIAAHIK